MRIFVRNFATNFMRMARPSSGKAVVVHQCGSDIFKAANLEDVDLPAVKTEEVLVKMLAAPINPSDYLNISGIYDNSARPTFPFVCGFEGVGEIIETGSDVTTVSIGDWVIPGQGLGTWREYGVCNAARMIKIDKRIGFQAAATMVINPNTAYFLVQDIVKLQPGQFIIQNGANSYVGKILIQIAKLKGFKTINVVRNRPNLEDLVKELKELGADQVVTDEELKTVKFEEAPVLAVDCVGGATAGLMLNHLANGGTLVNYGALSGQPIPVNALDLIFRNIKICGYWLTKTFKEEPERMKNEAIPFLAQAMAQGKIKLPEFEMFLLEDYKKALEKATAGFSNKKQMLVMDKSLMK